MNVSILSIIIGVMVSTLVGAGIRELRQNHKRKAAEKAFDKQLTSSKHWVEEFRQETKQPRSGQPPLSTFQALAHSLSFPAYEISGDINDKQSILVYQQEISRRKEKFPHAENMQLVDAFKEAFREVPEQAVKDIKENLERSKTLFRQMCEMETQGLSKAAQWMDSKDEAEKTGLVEEALRLKRRVIGSVYAEYINAYCDARQSVLRWAVPPEMRSAIAGVREIIATTVQKSDGPWNAMIGEIDGIRKELGEPGLTEAQLKEMFGSIAFCQSLRWSAYPLLKGECLTWLESQSTVITNYLWARITDNPLTINIIPFPLVESVNETKIDRRSTFEFHLRGEQTLNIPKMNPPGLIKIQEMVKSSRQTASEVVTRLLAETKLNPENSLKT